MLKLISTTTLCALALAGSARAAELVLPQNRNAFYSDETIELAVAGLDGASTVEIALAKEGAPALKFEAKGNGTQTFALPPRALAPGEYSIRLDGKEANKLTIAAGVNESTMLTSQTIARKDLKAAGANFFLGNAFTFGLLDKGEPSLNLRRRSPGMNIFDETVAADMPTMMYMYWTGYVTHKPFGSEKSWADDDMVETMRLFNIHTAQRLRRYEKNMHAIGTLDEPGLSWGKTPAGGAASGFPNWDEKSWYEKRGWNYTDNPASRPDADWMKYMNIRTDIMKENNQWAKDDLKKLLPDVPFSTDLYAPQAIMDGTDPMNQTVNDIPSSHVFVDWGYGKMGLTGGLYLEKAHDPTAKVAHAMNGQLFGAVVPQPQQTYAYRLMQNALLAGGLHSNWWLNTGNMSLENLNSVNEPAKRIGPLFQEVKPQSDTAVLWSYTELAMRLKDITAKEASKKSGEQIKLMIASWPENAVVTGSNEIDANAYSVGGNYKEQVILAQQALMRAGYPAHIVHEEIVASGVLSNYKTLVIVGQKFALPAAVQKAIDAFIKRGGKVIVDATTTQEYSGAVKTTANFKDPYFRWAPLFGAKDEQFKNKREASYHQTNFWMDEQARDAAPAMKAAMQKTKSAPVFVSDSTWLGAEHHAAGDAQLLMVINAHEELPKIGEDEKYFIYNYAPYKASYTLKGLKKSDVVYLIEGGDWKKVRRVENPTAPQTESFEPGEMKLYLVAPSTPAGARMQAQIRDNALWVNARVPNFASPWPLTVTVNDADGKALYRVYRSLDTAGKYFESFPLGSNAPAGEYSVSLESPLAGVKAQSKIAFKPSASTPQPIDAAVRVFDGAAIKSFLASKPEMTIAVGNDAQQPIAEKLAAALVKKGLKARVLPEAEVWKKANYPRVWNPFVQVYSAQREAKMPAGAEVKMRIALAAKADGSMTAKDVDGKDFTDDWKQPNSLVTVGGDGFVDFNNTDQETIFEPGVQLYFDDKRAMTVLNAEKKEVAATEEFQAKWNRPWNSLTSYVGGYQLPPQLPEAFTTNSHLILLGDSTQSTLVRALQASELLPQVVDAKYPGAGKAMVQMAWSPFGLDKNVIFIGASDAEGLAKGVELLQGM